MLIAGCLDDEVKRITSSIDQATKQMQDTTRTVGDSWTESNGLLNSGLASVKDGTIRNEVNQMTGHVQQAAVSGAFAAGDFARNRIIEDLAALRARINRQPAPERKPYIASANPMQIKFSSTNQITLTLAGWNLEPEKVAAGLRVLAKRAGGEAAIPTDAVFSPSPYQVVITFTPGTPSALSSADAAVVGRWGDKELFTIPVVRPRPNVEHVMSVSFAQPSFQSEKVQLVPNFNGHVGDWNLNSQDRRPRPPRCSQDGRVELRANASVVEMRITAIFNEGLPDFTRLASDTGWRQVYRLTPNNPDVEKARVDLNLGNDYAAAVVSIVDIVSDKVGAVADLPEYTHAMDSAPANGCVEGWDFYGDGPGNDDDAKLVVRMKPMQLKVRFNMPDGDVALPPAAPPAALIRGVAVE